MSDDRENARRAWRKPDKLWAHIEPLLPPRKPHLPGCHRPRVDDRRAMDAIFFVFRPASLWNALKDTNICSCSCVHHRFYEWATVRSSSSCGRVVWLNTIP
jgi:transposase